MVARPRTTVMSSDTSKVDVPTNSGTESETWTGCQGRIPTSPYNDGDKPKKERSSGERIGSPLGSAT